MLKFSLIKKYFQSLNSEEFFCQFYKKYILYIKKNYVIWWLCIPIFIFLYFNFIIICLSLVPFLQVHVSDLLTEWLTDSETPRAVRYLWLICTLKVALELAFPDFPSSFHVSPAFFTPTPISSWHLLWLTSSKSHLARQIARFASLRFCDTDTDTDPDTATDTDVLVATPLPFPKKARTVHINRFGKHEMETTTGDKVKFGNAL